jgi:NTP pyrophosphatase (non-canonical NTP hydrolase)
MELNQLTKYVREMKKHRGFDWTNLEQEMVLFTEEVGEVAKEVFRITKSGKITDENRRNLAFEVVDCIIYLLSIANMAGIEDIEGYMMEKEAINTIRFEDLKKGPDML